MRHLWATLGATDALRSIRVRVVEIRTTEQHIFLATNLPVAQASAALVGLIYRKRWDIELFFRWIKCILGCRHFFAESPQGVTIQLYLALDRLPALSVLHRPPPQQAHHGTDPLLPDGMDGQRRTAFLATKADGQHETGQKTLSHSSGDILTVTSRRAARVPIKAPSWPNVLDRLPLFQNQRAGAHLSTPQDQCRTQLIFNCQFSIQPTLGERFGCGLPRRAFTAFPASRACQSGMKLNQTVKIIDFSLRDVL